VSLFVGMEGESNQAPSSLMLVKLESIPATCELRAPVMAKDSNCECEAFGQLSPWLCISLTYKGSHEFGCSLQRYPSEATWMAVKSGK
jgi:hypothetical protein